MHIPDGFLDAKTALATTVLSTAGLAYALREVRNELPPRRIPLLGLSAAFLFAAQMVNFPVAGGTSGHLVGAALVAALLGPSAAVVVLATVLIVQCFLFADGGILALGANVFNMGLVATLAGFGVYRVAQRLIPGTRGRVAAMAFAGWCSAVIASVSCAGQLAWSGTVPWSVALPAMAGVHMLIGVGEGLISALVLLAVSRTRPDLLESIPTGQSTRRVRSFVVLGLLASLGVALFVAPFACPWPDGLEAVAGRLGFGARAIGPSITAPLENYRVPGLSSPGVATAAAGALGTLVAFGLAVGFSRLVVRGGGPSKSSHI
jgi:cobalt/nickel transport system permease protein